MNEVNLVMAQNPKFKFVNVVFETNRELLKHNKKYSYKTMLDLKEGELVVVKVGEDFKCVTVVEEDVTAQCIANETREWRWVVCRVDTTDYCNNLDVENKVTRAVAEVKVNNLVREAKIALEEQLGDGAKEVLRLVSGEE